MFGMPRPIDRGGQIFSADLLAKAMVNSGYKNTAYALAELIDNSIQAGAKDVEVIGIEEMQLVNEHQRRRLAQLAVFDNGCGMDEEVLRASLMFGNGTHLHDESGMGKFGMGLPNASFSQAKRVEVWSWKDGVTNSLWTYLDLKEILDCIQNVVPIPTHKKIPQIWRDRVLHTPGDSGTLVVWSVLDEERLTWKQSKATLLHTDELIGRIYRRFITGHKTKIRLAAFEGENSLFEDEVKVNDPLYLMAPSSTPAPFDKTPMFQKWGEDSFEVTWKKKTSKIHVQFSYARKETIPSDGKDRGHTDYGRHAGRNIGVSLMRAGRELILDSNWAIGYDPRERWWGCEVDFSPALDDIFGVTINKQAATLWSQFAQLEWISLAESGEHTSGAVIQRLREEGDPRGVLLEVAEYIRRQLTKIRDEIKNQTKGRRSLQRHDGPTDEDVASERINERAKEHPTPEDKQNFGRSEAKQLEEDLVAGKKYEEDVAKGIVKAVWERKLRLIFLTADLDGHAFFKVEEKPGGVAEVIINRKHPIYEKLYETLNPEELSSELSAEDRLETALSTLRLMFAAWARFEQETTERERRRLDDVRQDWGRMARFFLESSE